MMSGVDQGDKQTEGQQVAADLSHWMRIGSVYPQQVAHLRSDMARALTYIRKLEEEKSK